MLLGQNHIRADFCIIIQPETIHSYLVFNSMKGAVILQCFYISELKSKMQYEQFIEYMLLKSDYFSFVYFRYKENEKMKKRTREIHNSLKSLKIKSKFTNKWPGTVSFDEEHFYKFILYRSTMEAKNILCKVENLFDWDYPMAPMDLCFYKDGYCWFSVTAHEADASFYTDDKSILEDLNNIGIELEYAYNTEDLFYLCDLF